MKLRKLCVVAAAASALTTAPVGGAGAQRPAPEARIDAIVTGVEAAHAGVGILVPAGTYLRAGAIAAAGASRDGMSGRIDLVGRFHLDPFRESRWGPYAGGGLTARFDEGREPRGYLLIFAGVDGPASRGITTAFEAGLGGGARVGLIVRRADAERR